MSTFSALDIFNLAEISFIGGEDEELTFNVYTSASVVVDLSGATITWYLARLGESDATLTLSGTLSGSPTNQIMVKVADTDTVSLSGKFVQQLKIVEASGSAIRPSQGLVNISQAIT